MDITSITATDVEKVVGQVLATYGEADGQPPRAAVKQAVEMSLTEWVEELVNNFTLWTEKRPEFGHSFENWLEFYERQEGTPR